MKANDELRVVLRTPSHVLLDTTVSEIEAEDTAGRFRVGSGEHTLLTGLTPGDIVLRKADGSELRARVGWGSLAKVGRDARMLVDRAEVIDIRPPLRIAV